MFKDFTFIKYNELLKFLLNKGYNFYTVYEWIKSKPANGIILRHDVDRYPVNSLLNAKIENELGIKSTYYFRIWKEVLKSDILKEISSLGHEIGYHYEDLSVTNGDYEKAIKLFERNLIIIRKFAEINTISMHGRPVSDIDNRDLWKIYKYQDFGISGEAYLSIDYSDIYYFSDTGRTWDNKKSNVRDKVNSKKYYELSDTYGLINFIDTQNPAKIAILTHPERWNDSKILWIKYYLRDILSISAKNVLSKFR